MSRFGGKPTRRCLAGQEDPTEDLACSRPRSLSVRLVFACGVAAFLVLLASSGVAAKGFTRVDVVGSDGRWIEVHGQESVIGGYGDVSSVRATGAYLRLFFVGPGDFPANPARYYPALGCITDWLAPRSCRAISRPLARLLRATRALPRFNEPPTVLARIAYLGSRRAFLGALKTPLALADEVDLAVDRTPTTNVAPPQRCFPFSGSWHGPRASVRPRRFWLCPTGIYSHGTLYRLERGVWEWFALNVQDVPRPASRS